MTGPNSPAGSRACSEGTFGFPVITRGKGGGSDYTGRAWPKDAFGNGDEIEQGSYLNEYLPANFPYLCLFQKELSGVFSPTLPSSPTATFA
jgi:hypothetical protein